MVVLRTLRRARSLRSRPGIGAFLLLLAGVFPLAVAAEQPVLFDESGYRLDGYRAPVPEAVPGARTLDLAQVRALIGQGWIPVDVMGARVFGIGADGTWILPERHRSIPGARWLPVVGWGRLEPWQSDYLDASLERITGGDRKAGLILFCKSDCWLSWNAARRIAGRGYVNLGWFPGGVDAWADAGLPLVEIRPEPHRGSWSR
ncbi:PQQ-dependent catabolism-associated CXXCW motif protein [Paracoccus pantotrophus]|uniref:PQQ-dependent catabolism-associated CXXCW motif protein n=1 Tax=Paracoccus pantotrophus TaxID=82367 RepID=A0AAE6NTJ7_PARPN|nr:PQQ-dependent catabolism-associated CXXCW motif protein [Paracoccus pantotrophus]RKS42588.1 PQQ-dependent catabolism-associated CXXCW motif protein [Paracoccus pantotrophus]SFY43297.1 PQQ-dependent catabolism-associated CXXCW motif protein [Paracoccus pantotrophus]